MVVLMRDNILRVITFTILSRLMFPKDVVEVRASEKKLDDVTPDVVVCVAVAATPTPVSSRVLSVG
jgi:hypothetical protein